MGIHPVPAGWHREIGQMIRISFALVFTVWKILQNTEVAIAICTFHRHGMKNPFRMPMFRKDVLRKRSGNLFKAIY